MLKLIIYKELREIILSTKFAATFAVCSILIILAFYTGIKNYQTGVQEYNASKAAQLQQFETVTDWGRVTSNKIFLPPEPLSYLVMGVSNDIGRTATVSGSSDPFLDDSIYSEQSVFAIFRFLDLEFVFLIVLSLFAILFAFDAINGEKERGTLRLSFANSMPRATYILGKITGSFLALALPLFIPILIGMLMLPLMGVALSPGDWIRLGLFIVCSLLYLGVFLTLAVFVSCLTRHSSSSFVFMLVIWVFSVLIIPRASVLVAGNMVEVPTLSSIYFQKNEMERQNSIETNKRINEYSMKLNKEIFQSGDNGPDTTKKYQTKIQDFIEKITIENGKKVEVFTGRLYEERRNKQIKQEKLAFGISRISPAALFTLASSTLCGTSMDLKNLFQENAASYSKSFAEFINMKTGRTIGAAAITIFDFNGEVNRKPPQPINPREIPEFVFQNPELSGILNDALPDVAIILLFNLIFFCGAFLAFLRYDLR
jgi:ABC-type transport system involved in multi-copper enzyme maturation permease subunit